MVTKEIFIYKNITVDGCFGLGFFGAVIDGTALHIQLYCIHIIAWLFIFLGNKYQFVSTH